jgi:hypothetical protein
MGGIMGSSNGPANINSVGAIANGQRLVGKQKQTLGSINNFYSNLLEKNQHLDVLRQSLESE